MNPPQQSTTQAPSSKKPSTNNNKPADGISTKYKIPNLQESTFLNPAKHVLSYKGWTWSSEREEQYDGIIGIYTSLENAQEAGTRWLRDKSASHPEDGSDPTDARIVEWGFNEETESWEKSKALNGARFLESRVVRVKECEVMMGSSLPKVPKEGGGKEKGGRDVEEREGKAEKGKSRAVDEKGEGDVVEDMERLAV